MLTQTAVGEYQKKISEEYNSINLNIEQLVQLTREKYFESCEFVNRNKVLKCWGGGGKKERKSPTSTESVHKTK